MSLWANIKFFPEPTGELYGWLLATLVSKLDHKILKGGHFKILVIECTGGGAEWEVQNFLFHRFISQLLLKLAF